MMCWISAATMRLASLENALVVPGRIDGARKLRDAVMFTCPDGLHHRQLGALKYSLVTFVCNESIRIRSKWSVVYKPAVKHDLSVHGVETGSNLRPKASVDEFKRPPENFRSESIVELSLP